MAPRVMSERPNHATQPLVSVIVPAFNHALFVTDALDSIRDADYPNVEIVLIDDGSTDETWERVSEWRARNPAVTVLADRQPNVGLTRTLNRLLALASGRYVTLLASDDRLVRGGLTSRVRFLEAHPDSKAVFGDCRVIDGSGFLLEEHGTGAGYSGARRRLRRDAAAEIVEHWAVPGPVLLYEREAILGLGGYDESLIHEDWDLYLRLAARDEIRFLDEVVAEYRVHGENTVADPARAVLLAEDLRRVAWRSRLLFRGHLWLELIHETCTWAARAAQLRGQRARWAAWKIASAVMKLLAMAIPRRPSDQAGKAAHPQ
jgi:glycosyltransferase involved in cell wall biosynthesis